jgi:serine/threonine protein kinase
MQCLGPFSNRIIRQHLVQCQRLPVPRHFQQQGANYIFTQHSVDPVNGEPVHKMLSLLPHNNNSHSKSKFPSATPLHAKLLKAKSAKDSRSMVLQFSDLLMKCLALDPSRRIAFKDALHHPFFQQATADDATKANSSISTTITH